MYLIGLKTRRKSRGFFFRAWWSRAAKTFRKNKTYSLINWYSAIAQIIIIWIIRYGESLKLVIE